MRKQMELVPGWEIAVEVKGTVQEYALALLHIFNNVREDEDLVRVTNASDSNVIFVVCYDHVLDAARKYLAQFGEIKDISRALIVRCGGDIAYDYLTYNTIACDFREF